MTKDELLHRAKEAEELAHCLLEFAGNLKAHSSAADQPKLFWPESKMGLGETVSSLLTLREQRSKHLDASLFGEPAWDTLLTLYKANLSSTDLSVEQICRSNGPYESTARRWMAILVDLGLVEVVKMGSNDLLETARLTEKGAIEMTKSIVDLQDTLLLQGWLAPAKR